MMSGYFPPIGGPTGPSPLPSIIDYTGELRLLGNLPSPGHLVSAVPTWTAAGNDVMPESEWKEFDYTDLPVKIKDQNGKGACFPAGTLIRMEDGRVKRIEEVNLLDRVRTAEGNVGRVSKMFVRDADDGLNLLTLRNERLVLATEEHPILTRDGYKPIRDLCNRDVVGCFVNHRQSWSEIASIEHKPFIGLVYNLGVDGDNSYIADDIGVHNCNGHAAATSLELARNVAGKPHVALSAWYVYAILCGGWDRGSNILDALALLSAQGTCPETDMTYGEINPKRITAAAKTSAARFKLEAGTSLKTWPEIMTAVQLLRPLNLSIQVGNAFNNLDSEGVPGASRGPGNHAVCVGFGAKKSAKHGWLIKMWNSWGTVWGLNGFCWLGQAHTDGVSYFEAYDVMTAADDPTDPTNPPHGS
jgi:hypothetical protein